MSIKRKMLFFYNKKNTELYEQNNQTTRNMFIKEKCCFFTKQIHNCMIKTPKLHESMVLKGVFTKIHNFMNKTSIVH